MATAASAVVALVGLTAGHPAFAASASAAAGYTPAAVGQQCGLAVPNGSPRPPSVQCNSPSDPRSGSVPYLGGIGAIGGECVMTFATFADVQLFEWDQSEPYAVFSLPAGSTGTVSFAAIVDPGTRIVISPPASSPIPVEVLTVVGIAGCRVPTGAFDPSANKFLFTNVAASAGQHVPVCADAAITESPFVTDTAFCGDPVAAAVDGALDVSGTDLYWGGPSRPGASVPLDEDNGATTWTSLGATGPTGQPVAAVVLQYGALCAATESPTGAFVVAAACNPSSPGQQWVLVPSHQ
jgi:hypothetical protein